jgi:uncharacterized protein HemY
MDFFSFLQHYIIKMIIYHFFEKSLIKLLRISKIIYTFAPSKDNKLVLTH